MANFLEKKKIIKTDSKKLMDEMFDATFMEEICHDLHDYMHKTNFPDQSIESDLHNGLDYYEQKLKYATKIAELKYEAKDRMEGLSKNDTERVIKTTLSEIKDMKKQANNLKTKHLEHAKKDNKEIYDYTKKRYDKWISNAKELVDYVYKTVGDSEKTDDIIAAANKYFQKVYGFKPELRESRTL